MRPFAIVIGILGFVATLAVAPASAQQSDTGGPAPHLRVNDFFDQHPGLTKSEFEEFAAELGSVLRFRQLGDASTLGRGHVDISVQYANKSIDGSKGARNNTLSRPAADQYVGRSISFPQIVVRFGVSDRVDLGAWGGFDPDSKYGLAGVDTKIILLKQGPARPVSVSIRPSITSLVGPSKIWAGNASVDLSVSRAFGLVSPYAGVAASSSLAVARSVDVNIDPASAGDSLAYAGLSYRVRALILSAEVEKGAQVSYAFRIGSRF